jgi:transposase/transposase-like protein
MEVHSMETRNNVIRACEDGELTQEEIAEQFGVSSRWVRWLYRRWLDTGRVEPLPHGGGFPAKITPEIEQLLRQYVHQHSDATLAEIRVGCGLKVSLTAIWKALKRLGLSRKKKVVHASEQDRPDVQAKRQEWRHKTCQINAKRLVFLDQTGVNTRMHRTYGRAPKGERVIGSVPDKHYQNSTVMGAMRLDGTVETFVYDGGTDVPTMLTFIDSILARCLKPGDIVSWDNLRTHLSAPVIRAIERTGATVWPLPPYSPDMNPIEKLWSKVKTILNGVAARTRDALLNGLLSALNKITTSDIQNWFINCGYRKVQG